MRLIKYFKALGCKLVNLTDGGEGSSNPSAETRERMSKAKLGKPGPSKGKKHTPESIIKMRNSKLGISLKAQGKISPLKGRLYFNNDPSKPGNKKGWISPLRGRKRKPFSLELRQRLSLLKIGKKLTPEKILRRRLKKQYRKLAKKVTKKAL